MAAGSVSFLASSPTTKGSKVVSPVRAAACDAVFQSSYSGPTCRWQSMRPGSTYRPPASMTRSAGGKRPSGPRATIRSPRMAMAASSTPDVPTTRPPRTIVSTLAVDMTLILVRLPFEGQTTERLAGEPGENPFPLELRAQTFVKADGRRIPVEDRPLHAPAATAKGDPGQLTQQRATRTAPPLLREHEEILEVEGGARHERRVREEVEGE